MLHGDGGSVYDWKFPYFDTLARRFTAIAIDRPGLGYSTTLKDRLIVVPGTGHELQFNQPDVVLEVVDSLRISR